MFGHNQKQVVAQLKNAHRENLRKNLQQRLEAARTSGNTSLVSQLEAEARYLNLN